MPDGSWEDFPDDATDEEILAAINGAQESSPTPLRAGTGSFWGDVKQTAAQGFLPEDYAASYIQGLHPGSTLEPDNDGGYLLNKSDGRQYDINPSGMNIFDPKSTVPLPFTDAKLPLPTGIDAMPVWLSMLPGGVASQVTRRTSPAVYKFGADFIKNNPVKSFFTGGAAYSAAEQGAGEIVTSGQDENPDFSVNEMLEMGLFSSALPLGHAAAKKIGSGLANLTGIDAFRSPIRRLGNVLELYQTGQGELTKSAREALESVSEEGMNINAYTPEQIDVINRVVAENPSLNPAAKGRKAALAAIGVDTGSQRGIPSQNPQEIQNELLSPRREATLRGLNEYGTNELAPQSNLRELNEQLVELRANDLNRADSLFDQARQIGDDARLNWAESRGFQSQLDAELRQVYDDEAVDEIMSSFPKEIRGKAPDTPQILGPDGVPLTPKPEGEIKRPVNIRKIFEWRRNHLTKLRGRSARDAFDNQLDQLLEGELANDMTDEAVSAWREANRAYREYSVTWDSGDLVSKIIKADSQGAGLRYSPSKTANLLMNASETGIVNKDGVLEAIIKIKGLLGADSPRFREFQGEAAHRLMRLRSHFKDEQGGFRIRGSALRNHWQQVKEQAGDEIKELYSPEMIARMDNFTEMAKWADLEILNRLPKIPIGKVDAMTAKILGRLGDATFRFTRSASRQAQEMVTESAEAKAVKELYGPLFESTRPAIGPAPAGAGLEQLWDQEYRNILYDMFEASNGSSNYFSDLFSDEEESTDTP